MKNFRLSRTTGVLFILGALLVNVPYALLIANFNYPDILREPAGDVLTQFQAGGSGLILTWLAFAWSGAPLLLAIALLPRVLAAEEIPFLGAATTFGVTGAVVQIVGLLRWTFVVPVLAAQYVDPAASDAVRAAAILTYQAVHQYGGVVLGEHLGQALTIVWMAMISLAMFRSRRFPAWLGGFGLLASAIYALAQGELLATVMPDFPYWADAGLTGSLLWLAWMIGLGLFLLRTNRAAQPVPSTSRNALQA